METKTIVEVRGVRIGEGIPKIIAPISGKTKEEILAAAGLISPEEVDLIEWRADGLADALASEKSLAVLSELRDICGELPILYTLRTAPEGGAISLSHEEYAVQIEEAARSELVDLVDVELSSGEEIVRRLVESCHEAGVAVIASSHDFEKTPLREEILGKLSTMQDCGADILKIAVMPQTPEDVLTLLSATAEATRMLEKPIITMAMGELGLISRLSGETFGSAATFGKVADATAPGQMDVGDLRCALAAIHRCLHPTDNLFLIGFMGAGKSTVAKALAARLGYERVEMDQAIEREQGMAITEIFDKYGEEHFRGLETTLLRSIGQKGGCVVSCGGGVPMRAENVEIMKRAGKIVLLSATPQTILERVKDSTDRPLLNGHMNTDYIGELMEKRRPKYEEAADITIMTDGRAIDDICDEILFDESPNK